MRKYRMPSGSTLKERLAYFSKPDPSGCRLWTGAVDECGYGLIWTGGRNRRAHIVAWEEANGRPVPEGLIICHKCDVPGCIEPGDLYAGTHLDNNRDRERRGRRQAPRGESHYRARLTEADVIAIRSDARSSLIVGPEYGVNQSTINRVRNRETWKHVP